MGTIRGGMRFPTHWPHDDVRSTVFRILVPGMAAALLVVPAPFVLASPTPEVTVTAGASYYVDATRGDDAASGLDSAHPWRGLARVNQTTFHAGDQILLRAGSRWSG